MGFYDYRCGLTGVSLKGANAVLVPLHKHGDQLAPLALAMKGSYNRLGAIDGIEEDENTALVLGFFLGKLRTGEFVVDGPYLQGHGHHPIEHIEQLVGAFERNVTDNPEAALLNGRPITYALFSRCIWDVVAAGDSRSQKPAVHEVLGGSPLEQVYVASAARFTAHAAELGAMKMLLDRRGYSWRCPDDPSQHYAEEMVQYLDEARRTFADVPVVMQGLQAYEHEVGELLRD